MPLEPRVTGGFTRDYYNQVVVPFLAALEQDAAAARTDATTAVNEAAQASTDAGTALRQVLLRYVKPEAGIPAADLAAAVRAVLADAPGTPNNPITDPAAPRPAGFPVVWWNTDRRPDNVQPQDIIPEALTVVTATPAQITGLSTSAVGSSSFTASWTAEANSASYRVEHRVQGTATFTVSTTTGTSHTFTGLSASTTYEVRVAGVNTAGATGPYSTTVTVTTSAAVAATTLYAQSFETDTGTASPTSATVARSADRAAAGTYALKVTSTAIPYSVALPRFAVTAGRDITPSAKVSNASPASRAVNVQLLFFNGSNGYVGDITYQATVAAGTGFVTVSGTGVVPATATQAQVQVKVDFSAAAGDVLYVDDVTVAG